MKTLYQDLGIDRLNSIPDSFDQHQGVKSIDYPFKDKKTKSNFGRRIKIGVERENTDLSTQIFLSLEHDIELSNKDSRDITQNQCLHIKSKKIKSKNKEKKKGKRKKTRGDRPDLSQEINNYFISSFKQSNQQK